MIRIMFVCHGNICRSPMAEFIMKDLVKDSRSDFYIASSATSREEIGNGVHYGTKKKLAEFGISCEGKHAVQLTRADYDKYDYIVAMDTMNIRNIFRIIGNDPQKKVYKLLDFCGGGDVADPWYTGDFDATYRDVLRGCKALLKKTKTNFSTKTCN